jgi:hypothetical protein
MTNPLRVPYFLLACHDAQSCCSRILSYSLSFLVVSRIVPQSQIRFVRVRARCGDGMGPSG